MSHLTAFLAFIWDFVIGDDWRIAAGVTGALAVTASLAATITAWWVLPLAVGGLLFTSVWRAASAT